MNITFQSTDFNANNNSAILWYDADRERIGVAFKGFKCDQSGHDKCAVTLLDTDGYPINDNNTQYDALNSVLRENAVEDIHSELDSYQLSMINAASIAE